jgi:hypothetical protein
VIDSLATAGDVRPAPSSALQPLNQLRLTIAGRDGSPPSTQSLLRWITAGTKLRDGRRLRLKALKTPGGWRSSEAWVGDFYAALTADAIGAGDPTISTPTPGPAGPRGRTDRQRQEAAERAGKILRSLGC